MIQRICCICVALASLAILGCSGSTGQPVESAATPRNESASRPIPYPVVYSPEYEAALQRGTRSRDGRPGPRYWQQWTDYRLSARIQPEEKRLSGRANIKYHNNSPGELGELFVNLVQNIHAAGAPRKVWQEVTGGVQLSKVVVDGQPLDPDTSQGPGYVVSGTAMKIVLPRPVPAGAAVELEIDWSFVIPQNGAGTRMGWDADNLFFLAYWYPQMAVYDDVTGWQADPFGGVAEFYAGFGSYDLTIEAPEGWLVAATGRLTNPQEMLSPHILERLQQAEGSDSVVHVVRSEDLGSATTVASGNGWLAWHFVADTVRDVAFSMTRESLWDAARTPVGDRDGDGSTDYARIDAIYQENAPRWRNAVRYGQHAISFVSQFAGLPYPWPHMTAVETAFRGGGMEYPMMTLIGDYNSRSDSALYNVTVHELTHMWVPMIVSSDERRYSWMDEGTTSYTENQARKDFFPGINHDIFDQATYFLMARSGWEGEMMRWSDFHYVREAFSVASYSKPATVLAALRELLGEETFSRAYRAYMNAWAYKHPYPWDLFHTFESASGRELDWFWRAWYYETWTLDHAVADVVATAEGSRIIIEDRGLVPMPVRLKITLADGEVIRREVPVETWLAGRSIAEVIVSGEVVAVEIDPESAFPDLNRANNSWRR